MSKITSVSLGDHFTRFIDAQVDRGRYGSASDVLEAGLRLLEEQEAHLADVRSALIEAEESGVSSLDVLEVWAGVKARNAGNV